MSYENFAEKTKKKKKKVTKRGSYKNFKKLKFFEVLKTNIFKIIDRIKAPFGRFAPSEPKNIVP